MYEDMQNKIIKKNKKSKMLIDSFGINLNEKVGMTKDDFLAIPTEVVVILLP